MSFTVVRDPVLGEAVWLAQTARGLPLRVVPAERFREAAAVVTFRYGSVDLAFSDAAGAHTSPEGVAHYLEHKLFEDEAIQAFDRFGRRGAKVNAMTGFARTTYYFTCAERFAENLQDLLHLVSRAHITPENVAKERGIIAQELRMYEDSPDYRAFYDLLGALYAVHPVRHPVGGTVESIGRITAEELLRCYAAFYRTGNASLAVAGPVDPEQVLALAEAAQLAAGPAIPGTAPADTARPPAPRFERRGRVARARALLGCKERSLIADPAARLERDLVTRILLDLWFGAASPVREALRREGVADDSLSASYVADRGFGCAVLGGEADDPERLLAALRAVVARPVAVAEHDLERVRRKFLGGFVRGLEAVRSLAFAHAQEAGDGLPPFSVFQRMAAVSLEAVRARQRELFVPEAMAEALLLPGG
ncbi:MAG: insulinase family protein [Planctomycetes bacterium]|nr:insulinase family protein [Planctomycetota bacterium]